RVLGHALGGIRRRSAKGPSILALRPGYFRALLLPCPAARKLAGGAGDFAAELAVTGQAPRIQRAGLDRGAHGAAGLLVVAAVAEAALDGQRLDVGEAVCDVLLSSEERRVGEGGR